MGWAGRALRYAVYRVHSYRADALHDLLYDAWVAAQLRRCALFHGASVHCLASLRRACALGAITLVDRGMAHPRAYAEMLEAEHARWGLPSPAIGARTQRELREMDLADLVLVGSESAADTYRARGFAPESLGMIPYGVDTDAFSPALDRVDQSSPQRPFRVLYVGQVALGKGIPYLLQAWRQLAWRDAELWLVGNVSPEMRSACGSLLELPGVRTMGFVPHPAEVYRAADLFCLPTLSEGSALVTYEALACGLAVVTTAEAGSLATHEREALLCPTRDVGSLAAALQRLRDDPALRRRLGEAGRRLMEHHSWQRYGEKLVALYRRLLAERGGL
jgi:glycosyltransferase involved in cell wall biosynthesis